MSESEQPKESDKTIYQRDKTAKEPVTADKASETKPKPKPRKAFIPKKLVKKTDKVVHIYVVSLQKNTLHYNI